MSTVNGILRRNVFFNLMNLQTMYVLITCICTVALYRAVGIINIPFLLLYFSECGASFKVTTIDVNEQSGNIHSTYIIPIAKT